MENTKQELQKRDGNATSAEKHELSGEAMQWGFVFSREFGTRRQNGKIKQVSEAVKRSMYRVIAMITEFSIFRRCKKAGDCRKNSNKTANKWTNAREEEN